MIILTAILSFKHRKKDFEMQEQKNPAELKSAVIFGLLYAGISFLSARAYAASLKLSRPDEDPERFQQLRAAYEVALEWANAEAHWDDMADRAPSVSPDTPLPADYKPTAMLEQQIISTAQGPAAPLDSECTVDLPPANKEDRRSAEAADDQAGQAIATLTSHTARPLAAQLVDQFFTDIKGKPAVEAQSQLEALLQEPELASLALREEFELQMLRKLYEQRGLSPQFMLRLAQGMEWTGEERYLALRDPARAPDVMAWIRAAYQYEKLQAIARVDRLERTLLGPYKPARFFVDALNKRFLRAMQDKLAEFRTTMPEVLEYLLDERIVNWWERKSTGINLYWHHLFWGLAGWLMIAISAGQRSLPWQLRDGAVHASGWSPPSYVVLVIVPLAFMIGGLYEWLELKWQQRWQYAFKHRRAFVFGWPAAAVLLLTICAFERLSPIPLCWIIGPAVMATALWTAQVIGYTFEGKHSGYHGIAAIAMGLWLSVAGVITDMTLAFLNGITMFFLVTAGSAYVKQWVYDRYGRRGIVIFTYGWLVPLAALIAYSFAGGAQVAPHSTGWLLCMFLVAVWGGLPTNFRAQQCGLCFVVVLGFSLWAVDLLTNSLGRDSNRDFSLALSFTVTAYVLLDRAIAWRARVA
jgi:hypothetical protein